MCVCVCVWGGGGSPMTENHHHSYMTFLQCYYIGAVDIAATKLVRAVTKPISFSKPVEKICEDLKKKDGEICNLKYGMLVTLMVIT